jgi:hypothetical protein
MENGMVIGLTIANFGHQESKTNAVNNSPPLPKMVFSGWISMISAKSLMKFIFAGIILKKLTGKIL